VSIKNKFDEIFDEVMKEKNILDWWNLFDSSMFKEVEKRCELFIKTEEDRTIYNDWINEMAEDL